MSKDQTLGGVVLFVCILAIAVYGWLVFFSVWSLLALQLTGFVAVAGVLAIGAWVGWVMATTPPPKPLEDLDNEEFEAGKE